jgi:hypothetical protein
MRVIGACPGLWTVTVSRGVFVRTPGLDETFG